MDITPENLGLGLGLLGLLATFVGTYFTYISFINPSARLTRLIRNHGSWSRIEGAGHNIQVFRHERFTQYSIEIDDNEVLAEDFYEDWMEKLYRPNPRSQSTYVRVLWSGSVLRSELFVYIDEFRNFVPVPRVKTVGDKHLFFVDSFQMNLAQIVGRSYVDSVEIYLKSSERVRFCRRNDFWGKVGRLLGVVKYSAW
ncbi:hypothetical protein [Rhodovulum marinum]|uniref:hypothetical protein n=1 Tax=Rhodovulum marinum TaxID=320662 RepID=UPI001045386D|nr:hypothetical protein [Rhodovulum marinum]